MMNIKRMICCAFLAAMCTSSFAQDQEEWKLGWSDEFNINGRPCMELRDWVPAQS